MERIVYAGGDVCLYKTYILNGIKVVESTALLDDEVKKLYELTRRHQSCGNS